MYTIGNTNGEDTISKINANFEELASGASAQHTDAECRTRFIQEMNKKAALLGMENTTYYDPAGNQPVSLYYSGSDYPELFSVQDANKMSAMDALRLLIYASGIQHINDAWNLRQFTLNYRNGNTSKTATIKSTVYQSTSSVVIPSQEALLASYDILGGKTGSMLFSPINANTLVVVARSKATGKIYAVVDWSTTTNVTASYNKFIDTKAILDYVDAGGTAPSFSNGAYAVCEFPVITPSLLNRADITLLASRSPSSQLYPASVSKVMTAILLNDNVLNLNQMVTVHESDRQPPTGTNFVAGDVIRLRDVLQCMLMESSNTSAQIIARVVGGILLDKDNDVLE